MDGITTHSNALNGLPAADGDGSPVSFFQQRLWIHQGRNPEDTSYNLPFMLLLRGGVNVLALEQSVSAIASRHESLRTSYRVAKNGEPLQFVTPPGYVALPAVAVNQAQLLEALNRFLEHRFDLRRGPIFIARLLRLPDARHLLLFNVHHIAADAWSLKAILRTELQSAYAAFCQAQKPVLPLLTVQYRDYARAQRASDMSADLEYWSKTLKGYEDSLELPTTYPRQRKSGATSGSFVYQYPREFARELERLSRENGCTMFMCLLAALAVTISRYADKEDLCIGTTTANRPDVALEPLIGFFVNILPLRMQVDEEGSVAELLNAVRSQVLNAFEHPVPFERILQATNVAQRGSGNPLVPIVMRHQNFPEASLGTALPDNVTFHSYPDADEADEAVLELLTRERAAARCEIELSYSGDADGLAVEVVYAADLYNRPAVERLLAHHQNVLEGMFRDARQRVLELALLRDSDIQALLERSNRAPTAEVPTVSFVDRFDAQVQRAPDAVACWDGHGPWSYRDIDRRAHSVAHALAARGTGLGQLVAVCLPRGGDLLATLLGVWRALGAYVCLDPAYPTAYSRQIIEDAAPGTVVCDARNQILLDIDQSKCLRFEQITNITDVYGVQPIHPDALAYVMYTSGSTGKPKGVRVPHRQLNNWLSSLEKNLPFQPGEVVGQKTTSVFAAGVKEMFAGLLNGIPQVTIDDKTLRDVIAFVDTLAKHHVSRLNILPSHLASIMDHLKVSGKQLPALKVCITAGEPLSKANVLAFRTTFPDARLFNNYGCTEMNDITYYDTATFNDGTLDFVPIGHPIPNTKLYILDHHNRLVPDGVPGQLHVASVGLPDGYHNLPSQTAESFLPNPFGALPSTQLYNTGDVVRYLPDGSLDFIGRRDFRVKVRGFRIDVRQVEQVMSEYAGVGARAVVARGSDQLIAYYTVNTPGEAVQMAELRAFLQGRLPEYMVPDTFVLLDAMPQLPNGKLNRRALLETEGALQQSGGGYEPPRTETEKALAGIWGVVVNMPAARIGRQTHFFEIGGHSLSAMRVLARVKDTFGVELGLSELFAAPRLEAIAAVIDAQIRQRPSLSGELRSATGAPRPARGFGLLHDKVVLVTGGSRGIGLSTALLLAEQGAKVAINYRDSKAQALSVKETIEADGGTAEIFGADVTRADEVAAMVEAIHSQLGFIDVLVVNAHIHFRHRPFLEYEWADLEQKVSDELKAVFHPCRTVAPSMVRRERGSIIVLSSTLSKRSNPGFLAQSTAKAAVDAFVRSLASELGPFHVRANTVAPGVTLTDAALPMAPHVKESVAAICPMRRNGLPEDMAGAVLFLASDLSRFMTGAYLPVDGGFTTL
jgi:amino acid adenylation domain-containing protein